MYLFFLSRTANTVCCDNEYTVVKTHKKMEEVKATGNLVSCCALGSPERMKHKLKAGDTKEQAPAISTGQVVLK